MRKQSSVYFECLTYLGEEDRGFSSPALFVPTKASLDVNAAAIDIFRCVLDITESGVRVLLAMNRSSCLKVAIVDKDQHRRVITDFEVLWNKRQAGVFTTPTHSSWENSWTKFNGNRSYHLVLPGLTMADSSRSTRLVKETVRHHLQIGFTRIFISTTHSSSSEIFQRVSAEMSMEISSGSLIMVSYSDFLSSPFLQFLPNTQSISKRAFLNLLFDNVCLYMTKGTARFLGVWDLDELLIPHFPLSSVHEIVRRSIITFGRHAGYCSLVLYSAVVLRKQRSEGSWIAEAFNTSALRGTAAGGLDYKKSIIPTWRVFHTGFHLPGACKLPKHFTSCDTQASGDLCFSNDLFSWNDFSKKCRERHPFPHNFNDMVCEGNMKYINRRLAEIYHTQVHRPKLKRINMLIESSASNEYSLRYFPMLNLQ